MSPIKGLTDNVQPAFPRIGRLRKGGEAQRNQAGQVVRMGQDLPFFRFTSERPEVVEAFKAAYGEQPTLVNVYLPYPDVERNFSAWKERWAAGGLVHRCDGETMTLWQDKDGKYRQEPKACDGDCDEVGRLSLIVPELVHAGHVGYVVLETHGLHDLMSIQASLLAALEARAGNDLGLRGIRWTLRRAQEKISTPMPGGKRARREKWLVKLEPAADWVQLQLQAAHNATMGMLEAPRPDREYLNRRTGEVVVGEATVLAEDAEVIELPPEAPTPEYDSDAPGEDTPEAEPPAPEPPREGSQPTATELLADACRRLETVCYRQKRTVGRTLEKWRLERDKPVDYLLTLDELNELIERLEAAGRAARLQ